MTITQTVEIPADRRLIIDIPREVPEGRAQVEVKVIPFVRIDAPASKPAPKDGKLKFTRKELDEMVKDCPLLDELTGILHTDMSVEEIRNERLAKYIE